MKNYTSFFFKHNEYEKLRHEYTNSLLNQDWFERIASLYSLILSKNELWIFRFWKRSCSDLTGYAFPCRGRGQEWHRSWSLSYHAVHAVFVIQVDEVRSIDLAENSESLGKTSGKMERQDVKMHGLHGLHLFFYNVFFCPFLVAPSHWQGHGIVFSYLRVWGSWSSSCWRSSCQRKNWYKSGSRTSPT